MSAPPLLDVNVLLALTHAAHVHHALVQDWVAESSRFTWASCTVTQLGFVRLAAMPAIGGQQASPASSLALLDQLLAHPGHRFWADADGLGPAGPLRSPLVVGHRQVTDAYLLGLAVRQGGVLVTLDRGLLALAESQQLQRHLRWIGPAPAAHEPRAAYPVRPARRRG